MKIGRVAMILNWMVLVRFDCWGSYLTPTYNNAPYSVMPRRVLAVLSGIARRGAAGGRSSSKVKRTFGGRVTRPEAMAW
jgi:hypothetical protein